MPNRPLDGGDADAFWAFSLDLYGRPGIAEACIALQDAHGLDVNLLLLCCWLGWSRSGRLEAADLAAISANAAPWRSSVVEPLRGVRRALKTLPMPGAPALRSEVQRLELAAEREAQRLLVAAVPAGLTRGNPGADAAANLALYLAGQGCASALADPLIATLRRGDSGG